MALTKSLRRAPGLLREQPVLFVPMAVFALLQIPQLYLETLDPLVSMAASLLFTGVLVFVSPLFWAGTLGMANDAATGRHTSLGRFRAHAKAFYISMLVGYLFIFGVSVGFSFLIMLAAFVVLAVVISGSTGLAGMVAVGGAVALLALAFMIGLFAVHFFGHAIVVEGSGAVEGLQRSVEVVRSNLKSMLGYGALSVGFGGAVGLLYAGVLLWAFPQASEPGEPAPMPDLVPALLGSATTVVVVAAFSTFWVAFTVLYYRALVDADATADADHPSDESATPGPDAGGWDEPETAD